MRISVDVDNHRRVIRDIKRDIRRGAKDGLEDLSDIGKEAARGKIDANPRPHIFSGKLIENFDYVDYSSRSHFRGKLYNDTQYAKAQDKGVPAAEYADGGPPVQALLPWVAARMHGLKVYEGDDYDGGGDADIDSTQDSPSEDFEDEEYVENDELWVKDENNTGIFITVDSSTDSDVTGTDPYGNQYTVSRDAIVSREFEHPIQEEISYDPFIPQGTQVTWYNDDGELQSGSVVTKESVHHGVDEFWVRYSDADQRDLTDQSTKISGVDFTSLEDRPEFDSDAVTPSMREVSFDSSDRGLEENVLSAQDALVYNTVTGDTENGQILHPPIESNEVFTVVNADGDEHQITQDSYWEIRALEDFPNISKFRQRQLLESHYRVAVEKTDGNGGSISSAEYTEFQDRLTDNIFPSFKDREHLANVFSNFRKLEINSDRPHVNHEGDGWKLRIPDSSNSDYHRIISHEMAHADASPVDLGTTIWKKDPLEYKFSTMFPDRLEQGTNQYFDEKLPDWDPYDPEASDHTYIQAYMFTRGEDSKAVYDATTHDIISDDRDELTPIGFDSWRGEVETLARLNAQESTPAIAKLEQNIKEVDAKQVLNPDSLNIDEGDFIAVDKDGEVEILEYTGAFDGPNSPTLFRENDNEDVPTEAVAIGFKKPQEEYGSEDFYVGEDGTLYTTKLNEYNLSVLTEVNAPDFIGTVDKVHYDESLNEFPDLVSSDPTDRLHEAANMAFWYQVVHIANDDSTLKENSKEIVLRKGYSSTTADEVLSTFNEAINHPDPSDKKLDELGKVIENYPFFLDAYLERRKAMNKDAQELLARNGFNVEFDLEEVVATEVMDSVGYEDDFNLVGDSDNLRLDDPSKSVWRMNWKDESLGGEETVSALITRLTDWKDGAHLTDEDRRFNNAQYEKIVKETFDVNRDARWDFDLNAVSDDEKHAMKEFRKMSVEWLKAHENPDSDGNIELYRWPQITESAKLSKEIWKNPDKSEWEIDHNVLMNYATTEAIEDIFDKGIKHSRTTNIENDVISMVDPFVSSKHDYEGEVHLRGDHAVFPDTEVEFTEWQSDRDPFTVFKSDAFLNNDFSQLSNTELKDLFFMIDRMAERELILEDSNAENRAVAWLNELKSRGLIDDLNYPEYELEYMVDSIIEGDLDA